MRRRVCLMIGALLLLVATPVWAAIPCPIRIGSVRPQSGGMAQIGQSLANGLQMGLDKVQADGGIAGCKVELVVYDSQSVPTNAATLTRRLINQYGLNLILSSPISVEALAMLEITENAGIPLYVPSAASAKITGQGYKFVWKQSMTDAIAAAAMAKYIATDLSWKKVGVIYENSDYGKPTYVNVLKPGLQAGGVTVVSEDAIAPGDVELSSQLLRAKDQGADGILFWGHAKEGAILLRQNQQLGVKLPIAADTGIVYPEFLQLLPADIQAATNLVAPAQFVWTTQDPAQRAWIEAYKARFGRNPDVTAIDGYDAVFLLKQALEAAGTMDPDAVRQAIGAVSFQGVGGHIAFDPNGQARRPLQIVKLTPKDGPGFLVIKTITGP
jgi:branched-chain amino acid transport system substrate-binding protein